jgi:hypothetical protein
MIKTQLKPHSMGVLTKSKSLFRPMPVAYEERIRHRWCMTVHGAQGGQRFLVRNNTGVRMTVRTEEIQFMTTSNWVMPRHEWDPLTVEIYDYIGEDSNPGYIRDWMMSHTEIITGRHGYASDYKRNVELEKMDPTGMVIERWTLEGAFISSFNHEVVYDQEMGNMELTIMFDRARLIM